MSDGIPRDGDATYLGDGVYANHDGYQIWLYTQREDGSIHRIALEPGVLLNLLAYAKRIGLLR